MTKKAQSSLPTPSTAQITHRTLAASVRHTLREWLADGELLPGQKLTGRALSEQLDVSQTPVREAMLQLVAERALDLNPNRSVTVPVLNREQFIELRDIRVALESLAVRCAVERNQQIGIPTDVIDSIASQHQQMIAAKKRGDYQATLKLNRAVHFSAYELSKRKDLIAMIQSLWARTGPYLNFLYENVEPSIEDSHPHEALLEALRSNNAELAEQAIGRDILVGGKAILSALPSGENQ